MSDRTNTIQTDRLRITMPWAAWCATFALTAVGVWVVAEFRAEVAAGIRSANEGVRAISVELRAIREDSRVQTTAIHEHDSRIREHGVRIQSLEMKVDRPTGGNW